MHYATRVPLLADGTVRLGARRGSSTVPPPRPCRSFSHTYDAHTHANRLSPSPPPRCSPFPFLSVRLSENGDAPHSRSPPSLCHAADAPPSHPGFRRGDSAAAPDGCNGTTHIRSRPTARTPTSCAMRERDGEEGRIKRERERERYRDPSIAPTFRCGNVFLCRMHRPAVVSREHLASVRPFGAISPTLVFSRRSGGGSETDVITPRRADELDIQFHAGRRECHPGPFSSL